MAPLFILILILSIFSPTISAAETVASAGTDTAAEGVQQTETAPIPDVSLPEIIEPSEPPAAEPAVTDKTETEETEEAPSEETQLAETQGSEASAVEAAPKAAEHGSVTSAAPEQTNGDISSGDGTKKAAKSKHLELFIASDGSDASGDGSIEHPYASLTSALESVGDGYSGVDLCLLTDLKIQKTVHILGKKVSLSSYDGVVTLSRDENFDSGEDHKETALIMVGDPNAEEGTPSELIIEYVVIDEAGQKNDPLQDAMIEVYAGGKLVLGEFAELSNYGGSAAVHGWPGAEIFISSSGRIADTMDIPADGTPAVRAEDGCEYGSEFGSVILAHGEGHQAETESKESESDPGTSGEDQQAKPEENYGNQELSTVSEDPDDHIESEKKAATNEETTTNPIKETEIAGESEDGEKEASDDGEIPSDREENNASEEPDREAELSDVLSASALPAMQQAEAPLLGAGESSLLPDISYSLEAPEALSLDDSQEIISGAMGYPVPYTLSLNLSIPDFLITAMQAADAADIDIIIDCTLAEKLIPETKAGDSASAVLTPNFSILKLEKTDYSGNTIHVELKLGENWQANLQELKNSLELSFRTVLPTASYAVGETLISSANVTEMTFSYGDRSQTLTPSEATVSAETKLMGAKRAILVYDPNGGTGGPGEQFLPAEVNHVLEASDVPTHADVNGKSVLFLGWTQEKDHKIYSDGDTAPETVATVTLEDYQTVVVYAVYGYDRNNDGIPDVEQKLITLGFDANGGKGAPGPMTQAARALGTAEFAIPKQEPTRLYYTFRGWNENENATEGKYKYDAARTADRDITIREDTVLYAVWEKNPIYTLYFNGNGGTNVPAPQSAQSENGVAELTITKQIPTRSGRTFVGWATERYGAAAFDPGEDVRLTGGDVTLYAVWERNSRWSTDGSPKTGDESNVVLYAALAAGSVGAILVIAHTLKKRKK